ncbi:kinesin-like protein KIF19 [Capricornis sumatraensis]|uniref:kinesin-like protein KIF19 n=1 Tax=Capricornis sumatraensis TaxID=34865 RepID=UPI0036043869
MPSHPAPGPSPARGSPAVGEMEPKAQQLTVALRIRPLNNTELEEGAAVIAHKAGDQMVVLMDPSEDPEDPLHTHRSREKTFIFDAVFNQHASQEDVYLATTRQLVEGVVSGYNATVFAYVPSGAGKTHTMLGMDTEPGIYLQTLSGLFQAIEETRDSTDCSVSMSYLEIYNEVIRDLLSPSSGFLDLREDSRGSIQIAGITEVSTSNAQEIMQLLTKGNRQRTQEPTATNKTSSRSHAVLQVIVRRRGRGARPAEEVRVGRLFMVDLAGSERASQTQNQGKRMKEGAHINRSLLALGNCINALSEKGGSRAQYVNFWDSKLTRLLKDALGGNSRTVMIAHISPASTHFEESRTTLLYACRAKNIKTRVKRNLLSVSYHTAQYTGVISDLRGQLQCLKAKVEGQERERRGEPGGRCSSAEEDSRLQMNRIRAQLIGAFKEQLEMQRSLVELENTSIELQVDTSRHLLTIAEGTLPSCISLPVAELGQWESLPGPSFIPLPVAELGQWESLPGPSFLSLPVAKLGQWENLPGPSCISLPVAELGQWESLPGPSFIPLPVAELGQWESLPGPSFIPLPVAELGQWESLPGPSFIPLPVAELGQWESLPGPFGFLLQALSQQDRANPILHWEREKSHHLAPRAGTPERDEEALEAGPEGGEGKPAEPHEVALAREEVNMLLAEQRKTAALKAGLEQRLANAKKKASQMEEQLPAQVISEDQREVLWLLCRAHELELENTGLQASSLCRRSLLCQKDLVIQRCQQHRRLCERIIRGQQRLIQHSGLAVPEALEQHYRLYSRELDAGTLNCLLLLHSVMASSLRDGSVLNISPPPEEPSQDQLDDREDLPWGAQFELPPMLLDPDSDGYKSSKATPLKKLGKQDSLLPPSSLHILLSPPAHEGARGPSELAQGERERSFQNAEKPGDRSVTPVAGSASGPNLGPLTVHSLLQRSPQKPSSQSVKTLVSKLRSPAGREPGTPTPRTAAEAGLSAQALREMAAGTKSITLIAAARRSRAQDREGSTGRPSPHPPGEAAPDPKDPKPSIAPETSPADRKWPQASPGRARSAEKKARGKPSPPATRSVQPAPGRRRQEAKKTKVKMAAGRAGGENALGPGVTLPRSWT